MEGLVEYLEELLTVSVKDLSLDNDERQRLIGKIELLEMIKVINEKGLPNDN